MWAELIGYLAAGSVFLTFCMGTMVPLRVVALVSNVLFCAYAALENLYPVLVLHAALFPVNLVRLVQIRRLVRTVQSAENADLAVTKLLPMMKELRLAAGATLFRKGEFADRIYYLAEGTLVVSELGKEIAPGTLVGEIGTFAPDKRRTASVVCGTDCLLYELSESKAKQLYFQDPSFGYALLRLIIERLVENAREPERFGVRPVRQTGAV